MLDAAGLSELPSQRFWPLSNVWDDDSRPGLQVAEVQAAIAKWRGPGVPLMVSHGVTIMGSRSWSHGQGGTSRPVLGRTTSQGGFFVIKPSGDKFEIAAEGRL